MVHRREDSRPPGSLILVCLDAYVLFGSTPKASSSGEQNGTSPADLNDGFEPRMATASMIRGRQINNVHNNTVCRIGAACCELRAPRRGRKKNLAHGLAPDRSAEFKAPLVYLREVGHA